MTRPVIRRRPHMLRLLILTCVCAIATGCERAAEPGESAPSARGGGAVLILAAASTQDALAQIAEALQQRGGPKLTVSPGGSNALAQQIVADAPADLFLSANPTWADEVARHGHAAQAVALLTGQLVIVVPRGNPANIQQPEDLLAERVRRVALAGEQVPAGVYAEQALRKHQVYDQLMQAGRIVRGQNVRFTLAYVERGEVDAGIVYASDAAAASNAQIACTFDPADHEPIVYSLLLLTRGRDRPEAREVFEFMQSPQAGQIFAQHGFRPLAGSAGQAR